MDYKARFYSPTLGRFTQPDTIIPSTENPQSWNRYSYVYNNPILHNDPTGHCPTCLIGAIGGAIALTATVYFTNPDLDPQEYVRAALVGATAGLLIGSGVGMAAGTAMAATFIGAGTGALTAAAAYTVTAGDSYNGQEMAGNALIGFVTGAATAALGPQVIGAKLASSTSAVIARTGINAIGAQAAQIMHNKLFDDKPSSYPHPSESAGIATAGGVGSLVGEAVDVGVTSLVTAFSGSKTAGKAAGSLAYNLTKNLAIGIKLNRIMNWMDDCQDKKAC